jgi:polyphosphate kinase
VFTFGVGEDAEVWIGSADLMHRNLDRRVEALVRLDGPRQHEALESLFDLAMNPGTAAWDLGSDGVWLRRESEPGGEPLIDLQNSLIAERTALWAQQQL